MIEESGFKRFLGRPYQWFVAGAMLLFFAAAFLGPVGGGLERAPNSTAMQASRMIALALFQYSVDHKDEYPTGRTSTEIFQKLLDEHYVTDPGLFCEGSFNLQGKIKATSKVLRPENVCWDVTIPMDTTSSDYLPVVFLTGYRINYVPGGTAVPLAGSEGRLPGMAACYHSNSAVFLKNDGQPDGVVKNFISTNFDGSGKKYQQVTPDGPLGP